jgi:tetratricopeptide (TPR) repeat protein
MSDHNEPEEATVDAPASQGRRAFRRPGWLTLPTVESTSNSMRAVVVNLVLLVVILMAAPLIASQAARDQILLEPISVPEGLQVTGLTPEVAAARLNDGLLQIIEEADSDKASINAIPEGQRATFDIPESGISVDALVSYARQFFNLHETVIGGEFRCGDAECSPALVSLRLRINGRERRVVELSPMRRSTEAEYFREAGLSVMRYLDPFTALAAEVDAHPSNAATIARQLIASDHKDAIWAHTVLGNVRRNAGETEEAIAEYNNALSIDADFEPALASMAGILAEAKRYDEAMPFLDRLARIDPENPIEADVRADQAQARGDIDGALAYLLEAANRDPLDGRYKTKAAMMLLAADREEEALELAWSAFEIAPADEEPIGFLGGYYGGLGDYATLERLYRDAAEFSPRNHAYLAMHATLLMSNGDYKGALSRLDQALLEEEGNVQYRVSRANALSLLGRTDDSLFDLNLAEQRDPSNAAVLYAKGQTLAQLGRKEEALVIYQRMLTLEPEEWQAEVARSFIRMETSTSSVELSDQ